MSGRLYVGLRCRELGYNPLDITGPSRRREWTNVRIQLAKELRGDPFNLSVTDVAQALGRRNHTSAIWWLRGGRRKK